MGAGEAIDGTTYRFTPDYGNPEAGAISRPLESNSGFFHNDRWRLPTAGSHRVYHHQVGGRRQLGAKVDIGTWFAWPDAQKLIVKAAADGGPWRQLGEMSDNGDRGHSRPAAFALPGDMFPADTIRIRLETDSGDKLPFQITRYEYEATPEGPPCSLTGATEVCTLLGEDPGIEIAPRAGAPGVREFGAEVTNRRRVPVKLAPLLTLRKTDAVRRQVRGTGITLAPGATKLVSIPYDPPEPGNYEMEFALGNGFATRLGCGEATRSWLYADNFGEGLPSPDKGVGVWWASSGWKVSRDRALPTAKGRSVRIRLDARSEEATVWVDEVSLLEAEAVDEWTAWQEMGLDAHSVVADPLFLAPEQGDYRLKPESPALKLGFEPIPFERIGCCADPLRASWPVGDPANGG